MKKGIQLFSVLLFLFYGFNIHVNAQYKWTDEATFPGASRDEDVSFTIGHYGFIGAGTNGGSYYKDFYRWDQTTNTWTAIANYPGAGYELTPIGFSIEGKGYVGLGWTGSGPATDLWRYDTINGWTSMTPFPGTGRYDANVFVIGHKAYIIGGSAGGPPYLNDVWMYDAHQNKWKQLNNSPTGDIEGMASFAIGKHGYMGGGWNNTIFPNTFWQYDTINDSWTSIDTIPVPGGLGGLTQVFVLGSKAYVCIGWKGTNRTALSYGYAYDTITKTWSEFTNMGANHIERYYSVAFAIGNFGYIGTGMDSVGNYLNTFWQYGPYSDEGINEVKSSLNISIYPNPSNGLMNLVYNGNLQKGELVITDLLGKVIDSHEISGSNGRISFNETFLNNGMYFYKVIDSGSLISSGKFIIAK